MDKEQRQLNQQFKDTLCDHAKHLEIANNEMGEVKKVLESVKTDLDWIKKFFWVIAGSSISSLIAILTNILK